MNPKEIYSVVAILLTFIGFYPYISSVFKGQTKPHVFSWVIWGISTLVVFFAQLADDGGAGAWPTGVAAVVTFYVAFLAYAKRADVLITKSDWVFFLLALFSIPIWYFTSSPLWAVLILTLVDILGSIPTFRKAYYRPFDENILFYLITGVRCFISILALEHFSVTTILFPAAIGVMCFALIWILALRRKVSKGRF